MNLLKTFEFHLVSNKIYDLTVIFSELKHPSKLVIVFSFHNEDGEGLKFSGVPYSYSEKLSGYFKYVSASKSGTKQTVELLNPPSKANKMVVKVYSSAKSTEPVSFDLLISSTKLYVRHVKHLSTKSDSVVTNFLNGIHQSFFKNENIEFFWTLLDDYKSSRDVNLLSALLSKIINYFYKDKKIYALRSLVNRNIRLNSFIQKLKSEKTISIKRAISPSSVQILFLSKSSFSNPNNTPSDSFLIKIVRDLEEYSFPIESITNDYSYSRFENLGNYSSEEIEVHALILARAIRLMEGVEFHIQIETNDEYLIFLAYFMTRVGFLSITNISLTSLCRH